MADAAGPPVDEGVPPAYRRVHRTMLGDVKATYVASVMRVRRSNLKDLDDRVRQSKWYGSLMFGVTIFAVFMDDVRLGIMPKDLDIPYFVLLFFCCFMFVFDIVMSCIFEPRYTKQVMFFLDTLATVSMPLQVILENSSSNTLALGRLARLVRILRVIRIMRVARFASKATDIAMDKAKEARLDAAVGDSDSLASPTSPASPSGDQEPRLKRRMSLLGLGIGSVMDDVHSARGERMDEDGESGTEQELSQGDQEKDMAAAGVREMGIAAGRKEEYIPPDENSAIGNTLVSATTSKIVLLVLVLAVGFEVLDNTQPNVAAATGLEILDLSYDTYNDNGCFTGPDAITRDFCVVSPCCSEWNLLVKKYLEDLTIDSCNAYIYHFAIGGNTYISRETGKLRTLETLQLTTYTDNTVLTMDIGESIAYASLWSLSEIFLITLILLLFPYWFGKDVLTIVVTPLEIIYDRVQTISNNPFSSFEDDAQKEKSYELGMVKMALTRLTKLLQVGLGPAASGIISKNLQAGSFSALQSGSKLDAVFGFIYIRDFTPCCEELETECVVFVNTIAAVVADQVMANKGAVNKNLGGAFLTVWKYGDQEESQGNSKFENAANLQEAAECSLQAYVTSLIQLRESAVIQHYAESMSKRMNDTNYQITIGCGLHQGWGIEGAVGSEQKIDATYLSPNVNLSARLMSATKFYGVDLLMSHYFADQLSEATLQRCRKVDCVTVKGSTEPMTMYTYEFGEPLEAEDVCAKSAAYYEPYISGDWDKCKTALEKFLAEFPDDGPGNSLKGAMDKRGWKCPSDWKGINKLSAK